MNVTVIIPCFNLAHIVHESVASCGNIPCIVIDDGSTEHVEAFDRLPCRVVHQENRGLAGARNRGFAEADTEYVIPLDADDLLHADAARHYCDVLDMNSRAGVAHGEVNEYGPGFRSMIRRRGPFHLFTQLIRNQICATAVIRRQAWVDAGGYAKMPRVGHEDWDFWFRVYGAGWDFEYIDEILFDYRRRGDSMTSHHMLERHQENHRYILEHHGHLMDVRHGERRLSESAAIA